MRGARRLGALLALVPAAFSGAFAAPAAEDRVLEARLVLSELEAGIQEVLRDTGAPGAAAALARADGIFWAAGFGVADRESGRAVAPDTPFRLGSVAKSFVGLAVLQLVEEGKLDLDDRLSDRAPEIAFENRWQATHPLRLGHLLEHTTGWDDIHLREYAHDDPLPIALADGLAFHPRSRTSRWPAGTHASYCNSGPAVAAYLVGKASGRTFEEHVRKRLFDPLGMKTASYLPTAGAERELATGYAGDGVTPVGYWHVLVRPSGSLNAPVTELAQLTRLLLGRGEIDGVRLLTPASVTRMETPTTSAAARAGVSLGYALSNYPYLHEGFVLQGHSGGINGGVAEYAYLPGHDLGYAVAINSIQGDAFRRIRELLRGYLVRGLEPPAKEPEVALTPAELAPLAGWYVPVVARQEITRFLVRWASLRVRPNGRGLSTGGLIGPAHELTHVGQNRFRVEDQPRASVVFLGDGTLEGTVGSLRGTYRRVPAARFWLQAIAALVVVALMASSVLFALVWLPRKIFGRMRGVPLAGRAVPLAAVASLGVAFALVAIDTEQFIWRFGRPTVWSVGQWLLVWGFALLSVCGLWVAWRGGRAQVDRWVRWHSLLVAAANLAMAIYLAWWGIVGWRSWV